MHVLGRLLSVLCVKKQQASRRSNPTPDLDSSAILRGAPPFSFSCWLAQAVCTEAGMFALRERRIHVTQEDFEMSVAKVMKKDSDMNMSIRKLWK